MSIAPTTNIRLALVVRPVPPVKQPPVRALPQHVIAKPPPLQVRMKQRTGRPPPVLLDSTFLARAPLWPVPTARLASSRLVPTQTHPAPLARPMPTALLRPAIAHATAATVQLVLMPQVTARWKKKKQALVARQRAIGRARVTTQQMLPILWLLV